MPSSSFRLARTAALAITLATAALAGAAGLNAAQAESTCTAQNHPDAITTLTLDDTTLQGKQTVRIDFAGAIPDGSCAGDTVVLVAPPNFPLRNGSSPLRDADGVQLGTMTVLDNVVTITFNTYVENHDHVTFAGHFYGSLSGSEPDNAYNLYWDLGDGTGISTPVTTNSCVGCTDPRTRGSKAASLTADHEIRVYFDSAPTSGPGQVVTFTDVLGPGQRMDCTRFSGWIGSLTSWGNLVLNGGNLPVTVLTCDDAGFTATMTATAAGQYLDLQAYAFTTEDRATYPDTGTVTQDGHTDQVSATAREYSAGAHGSGDLITANETTDPTPTPTPPVETEDPTPTPPVETDDPTPTPPVETDDPTPTPPVETDDPTPTPPVETDDPTPTPPVETEDPTPTTPVETPTTPVETPTTPVETPTTPVESPTIPVETPTPAPPKVPPTNPTPGPGPKDHDILPNTGADASTRRLTAVGTAMLAAGVFLVCATRRRSANPS